MEVKALNDKKNRTHPEAVEDNLKAHFNLISKEFWSCNAFRVTVGTNSPCGGDAGHGGKTLFRLRNLTSTDWDVFIDKKEAVHSPYELTILLYGDTEAQTFADSLIFAGKTLKKQIRKVGGKNVQE